MNRFGTIALTAGLLLAGGVGVRVSCGQEREAQKPESPQELFERAYYLEHGLKKLEEATVLYRRVAALAGQDRELEARALLRIAACERQVGRDMEALEIAKQVLAKFSDLPEIKKEAEASVSESGAARRILRIYDVGMIVTGPAERSPPTLALPRTSEERVGGGASKAGSLSFGDVPAGTWVSPDRLVELIRANIADDSWENARARIEIEGTRLIVVQTPEVHAQVEAYLEQLRLLRGRLITIETELLSVDRKALQKLGAGPVLTPEQAAELERRVRARDGALRIAHPRATVFNRQTAVLSALRQRTYVENYEVNMTGVVPTVEPRVAAAAEGVVFTVRPTLVERGSHVLLQVSLRAAEWSRKHSRRVETEHGAIDLPAMDEVRAETSVLAPSGRTVVAAVLRSAVYGAEDGEGEGAKKPLDDPCLVVTVRATISALGKEGGDDAGRPAASKRPLRSYNVSLLTEGLEPTSALPLLRLDRGLAQGAEETSREWGSPLGERTLVDLITANLSPDSWSNSLNKIDVVSEGAGELVVVQTPEVHAQIQGYLAALRSDRGTLLGVEAYEIALGEGAFDAVLAATGGATSEAITLPSSVLDDLLAGRVEGAAVRRFAGGASVNGQRIRLGEARTRRVIQGYERVSGGTGPVVAVESHAVIAGLSEGFELDVRAKVVPGGRLVMVDAALDAVRLESLADAKTKWGTVDLPVTVTEHPTAALTFPMDRVLVMQMGQGLQGIQERTLTLVRVRPLDVLGSP